MNFILSSHEKYDVNIVRMLMDLHMHLTWAPGASFGTGAYLGLPSPQAKRDRLKNGEVRRLELYFVALLEKKLHMPMNWHMDLPWALGASCPLSPGRDETDTKNLISTRTKIYISSPPGRIKI